ncbi:hypothetical protein NT2_01_06130 [Caenibius tardaugens NBRC 16725]|uniref:Uncharacterized protein n=1 Tax=Caenibius tardaugens NBRC 16725 TaxID=1219035 RepID=U2ZR66_9SPHN|nr:DUF6491 family protein [Caenibius tardaugens]GAD47839.1 hypothetical protein NT2_01_06130 [Caenibius tardaugens NBRC 16725]
MKPVRYLAPLAAFSMIAVPQAVLAQEHGHASVANTQATDDASIAFANQGGVKDWRAKGSSEIYFEDTHGQWYLARLMGSSPDLSFAEGIRIDASPSGSLDKWSAVYVKGQRYTFESFVKVNGPPKKSKKAKHVAPRY